MNAWSQLPNAHHIDWVLQSMKDNPELWDAAWYAGWDAVRGAAMNAAMNAARGAARGAGRLAAMDSARLASRYGGETTLAVLVVYDDCDQYLSMTYEQLHAWAILSETPQAVLLLPLKWIQEHECLVTTA